MNKTLLFGNARFTAYGKGVIRLEYSPARRFSPFPSILMGKKLPPAAAVTARRKGKTVVLRTASLELSYRETGQGFTAENLKIVFPARSGKKDVWRPGREDAGNLGTIVRCMDVWGHRGDRPEKHPVKSVLSRSGFHVIEDTARVYWNTREAWAQKVAEKDALDWYFFGYGPDFRQALSDFVTVFGKIPMVPAYVLGLWYSKWAKYSEKDLLNIARRFKKEGIPLDVMVIDTDWRQAVWGGYDWNKKYFPNPERALKRLAAMGLNTTLNDHPGYNAVDPLPENDSAIPKLQKAFGERPHEGAFACDWSRKKAVALWKKYCIGKAFDQGMDFWWIDGTGKPPFPGTNDQGWLSRHYFELAEEKTGKRGLVLARFGGIGSHRYPVQFSGDAKSDWATLARQIRLTAESCGAGAAWWSHDLGGFWGQEPVPDELYIRWVQFGALSPVMRLHSHFNGERRPWQFKKSTLRHFREITRFRYALFPYLYTLAYEAHVSGMPLVRPMFLEDPENEKAYVHPYQYCLGRDLLVMPAHEPAEIGGTAFKKQVYFPEGEWVDVHTGEVVFGSLLETIAIPLHRLPVYARVGSIIPCQDVVPNLKTAPKGLWLDVYPKDTVRAVLYEDDGLSKKYLSGKYAKTRIGAVKTDRKIAITVSAPAGPYRPPRGTVTVNCFLRKGETAKAVRVNGRRVSFQVISRSFAGTVKSGARFVNFTVAGQRGFRAELVF